MLVALRDAGVRHVVFRAAGLAAQSPTRRGQLIDHVRRLEGLRGPVDEPGRPRHTQQAAREAP